VAKTSTPARSSRGSSSPARSTGSRRTAQPPSRDPGVSHDIIGIGLVVLAIAVAIAVWFGQDAPVPGAINTFLRLLVGVGANAVPLILLVWAFSIVFDRREVSEAAIGGGLGLVFVAGIAMFGAAVPVGPHYWSSAVLVDFGGYLGGGVAWALTRLLGSVITYVVLVGAMLVGIVLATGARLADAWYAVLDLFETPEAEELERPVARRKLAPGAKTLPLEDLDAESAALVAPTAKVRRIDPEAERRTLPVQRASVPRSNTSFELPPLGILRTSPVNAAATRASPRLPPSTSRRASRTGWPAPPSHSSRSRSPRA
jgi:hypothetical protein